MNLFHLLLANRCQRSCLVGSETTRKNEDEHLNSKDLFPSYTILFQHSLGLSQRISSALPRLAIDSREREIYDRAKVIEPGILAERDSSGFLLVKEAFEVLREKCDGAVVLVKVADVFQSETCESRFRKKRAGQDSVNAWLDHGAVVDLCSDPLGWDDGKDLNVDSDKHDNTCVFGRKLTVLRSRIDDLEAVATAIKSAATSVSTQGFERNEVVGYHAPKIDGHGNGEVSGDKMLSVCRTVPVLFDSIGPLIKLHGVHNFLSILHGLTRNHWRNLSCCDEREVEEGGRRPMLSPIFLPILKETVNKHDHILLEDAVDAVVSLADGEMTIIRTSPKSGKVTKEVQPFEVVNTVAGSSSQWGCGSIHFFGDAVTPFTLFPNTNSNDSLSVDSALPRVEQGPKTSERLGHKKMRRKKIPVALRHEQEHRGTSSQRDEKVGHGGPHIFLQDDDPDFDDFDEEDPDDDLDL